MKKCKEEVSLHINFKEGIPKKYWSGDNGRYNILILELLGKNLEELYNEYERKFSLKTICNIAEQLISRIEFFHSREYIHRDIKPENFLIGNDDKYNIIHMIKFGSSKRYIDPITRKHSEFKDRRGLSGTARYASINAHLGIEPSRRDDVESLGYVLVYFMKSRLPWQGLRGKTKIERYKKIVDVKIRTDLDHLCTTLPPQIKQFLQHTRDLRFEDKPDYNLLRGLIRDIILQEGFTNDDPFQWSRKYVAKEKINISTSFEFNKINTSIITK